MLSSDAELIVPATTRHAHRTQTVLWVLLHLVSGLLVAICLFILLPLAGSVLVQVLAGQPLPLDIADPSTVIERVLWGSLAALVAVAAVLSWWPLGHFAARSAGRFLGPTTHDRLQLAVARADREADRNRIARDLHDGIGHALTIVNIQAAAGRRLVTRDPVAAEARFETIETTARSALNELDAMLAVIREEAGADPAPPDLRQIIATHQRGGLQLQADIDPPRHLPELLQRHLGRILSELLSNAQRHGSGGDARLQLHGTADAIILKVDNPLGTMSTRANGGRGLIGVRERVELFGGTSEFGPRGDRWVSNVTLPRPAKGHGK